METCNEWIKEGFDHKTWKTGLAPFASGGEARTEWKTPEITSGRPSPMTAGR